MKYKVKQETKPHLPTFGKYKAVAVHHDTIESDQIVREVEQRFRMSRGAVEGVLSTLSEIIRTHLQHGDKVRLEDLGLLKLEIESEKVDTEKDFKPRKHIRGVRLHFIPESRGGKPTLYQDIKFEREK